MLHVSCQLFSYPSFDNKPCCFLRTVAPNGKSRGDKLVALRNTRDGTVPKCFGLYLLPREANAERKTPWLLESHYLPASNRTYLLSKTTHDRECVWIRERC